MFFEIALRWGRRIINRLMNVGILLATYLAWHYGEALKELVEIEKNLLWFFYHQFSIALLFKTLFTPFYRIQEEYRGFNLENLFSNLVANTVSRTVGFILRITTIFLGLLIESILALAAVPVLATWIMLPAVVFTLLWATLNTLL